MFRVICSRAQFELVIYVSNEMPEIRKKLEACSIDSKGGEYPEVEAIQSFQQSLESKIPDENDVRTLVRKCNSEMEPTVGISANFKRNRLIIILCEDASKQQWSYIIRSIFRKKYASNPFCGGIHNPLVLSLDEYDYVTSNGFEAVSILFFIDSPDEQSFQQRKEIFQQSFNIK